LGAEGLRRGGAARPFCGLGKTARLLLESEGPSLVYDVATKRGTYS
jgi:hypothetical protein